MPPEAAVLEAPPTTGTPPAAEPPSTGTAPPNTQSTAGTPPTATSSAPPTTVPVTQRTAPPAAGDAPPPPDPSEWRQRAIAQVFGEAKDDDPPETKAEREKLEKLAGRYNTMGDALKALREAQAKISAGIKPMTLPKDATPEQVKAYREAAGIPEEPTGYDLGLPKGTVLADGDKELLDNWIAKVHGAHAPPAVVQAGAAALVELRDAEVARITQQDLEHRGEAEETLRAEWGNQDFIRNRDGVRAMLGQAGEEVSNVILNARGLDGRALANNPAVLRWLSAHARELGYLGATVVPSGGDLGASVAEEMAALKKQMSDDPNAWAKNVKGQQRYMELWNQQQRLAGKKAA